MLMKLLGGENDHSNLDQQLTLHLRRGLSPNWTLDLGLKYGVLRPGALPGEDAGWTTKATDLFATKIFQPEVSFLFWPSPQHNLSPFLGFGLGISGLFHPIYQDIPFVDTDFFHGTIIGFGAPHCRKQE